MDTSNALRFPDGWREHLIPRHGGLPGPAPEPVRAAPGHIADHLRSHRDRIEETLGNPLSDPGLVKSGRAFMDGAADPLGAAVIAKVTGGPEAYVDGWIGELGLPFAACACAELTSAACEYGGRGVPPVLRHPVHPGRTASWQPEIAVVRVRTLLAHADDAVYEEAVADLAHHRVTRPQRVVVSFLVPSRQDWVDECCALAPFDWSELPLQQLLFCSLGTARQVEQLDGRMPFRNGGMSLSLVATTLEGLGTAFVPLLTAAIDREVHRTLDAYQWLFDALAAIPSDEAFGALVNRALQKQAHAVLPGAVERWPVRAVRMLAPAASGGRKNADVAAELLAGHLRAHPELATSAPVGLSEPARAAFEKIAASVAPVEEAAVADLPPLLAAPPWTRVQKKTRPVVIKGLTPPAERSFTWLPGEREDWLTPPHRNLWRRDSEEIDWPARLTYVHQSTGDWRRQAELLIDAPEELVRPLLVEWLPGSLSDVARWLRPLIARFESDVRHLALMAAVREPRDKGALLLPFQDVEVAGIVAGWLARLKSTRPTARAWLARHGVAAVRLLVPAALGKAGTERRNAEGALRELAEGLGDETVVEAARAYGDKAAAAIGTLLATDPLEVLPAKLPVPGDWCDLGPLPRPRLRDGGRALPAEATRHLITMLALSRADEPYLGLEVVREVCEPGSLARFCWSLFLRWHAHGAPAKDAWALSALGLFGDDDVVRALTPMITAWPGEGGHAKAVAGLDVLAGIGTDVALAHLHGIAQRAKFKGVKARAQDKIEEVAEGRGLTADQLQDRIVPDFGLDATGGLVLDYGPRRFSVGFDEALRPYVLDETGRLRKVLPKPGATDDQELAPAAWQRFATLKKEVRAVAADHVRRLETAMVRGRRWTPAEFRLFFLEHPLMWHIARRLVWNVESGGETSAFRIAEDRTLADLGDDALALPESAGIGIAHPVELGGSLAAWADVFADYEILQPFRQLGRAVHALTGDEKASGRLARFEGVTVSTRAVLGLQRSGWERGEPQDAGGERWISRKIADDLYVVIDLDPGIQVGVVDLFEEQGLDYVWLGRRPGDYGRGRTADRTFGELAPVIASEILSDLTTLVEAKP